MHVRNSVTKKKAVSCFDSRYSCKVITAASYCSAGLEFTLQGVRLGKRCALIKCTVFLSATQFPSQQSSGHTTDPSWSSGFSGGEGGDGRLLGCNATWSCRRVPTFQNIKYRQYVRRKRCNTPASPFVTTVVQIP